MGSEDIEQLRQRYVALLRRLGAGEDVPGFDELVTLYSEPQRSYHNLSHITRCLAELDQARHIPERPDEVEAALWFHDAVYDVMANDNEEQSAIFASRTLAAAGVDAVVGRRIAELILATMHRERPEDPDAQFVVDVDLAGLADPSEEFFATSKRVRDEYPHVTDEDFAAGRRAFMGSFLERESIYATPHFRERLEDRARANLKALIS